MAGSSVIGSGDQIHDLITESRKAMLREMAMCALKRHFGKASCPPYEDNELKSSRAGVFVTLKEEGELRGCVGFVSPPSSLVVSLMEAAVLAATEDPRFLPLSEEELDRVELEITVLGKPSPLKTDGGKIDPPIKIGLHGLIVESRFGRGLLLPQVATEWGFNVEEFLKATCVKAGLDGNCWKKSSSRLFFFEAMSF